MVEPAWSEKLLSDLMVTDPPELAWPRRIAAGGNDGTGAQIQAVARHQFDGAVDVLGGIGLDQAVLIDHLGLGGNAAGIGNQIAFVVHRTLGSVTCALNPRPSGDMETRTFWPA